MKYQYADQILEKVEEKLREKIDLNLLIDFRTSDNDLELDILRRNIISIIEARKVLMR